METTLKVLVAEDEPLAREFLVDLLNEIPDVEVVAAVGNGLEALRMIAQTKPALLFLDIEMPKLDGFEVLELLEEKIPTIFVTAYDSYAVKAFETAAIDYVKKPFRRERLLQAVTRARQATRMLGAAELGAMVRSPGTYASRLAVKEGSEVAVIAAPDLEWARSEDDYVRLRSRGKEWLKLQTLASLETSLDPKVFVRIHRTCLVNVALVVGLEPETRDRFWVLLKDGTRLPASRQGEKRLRETLGL